MSIVFGKLSSILPSAENRNSITREKLKLTCTVLQFDCQIEIEHLNVLHLY